ncbi:MAG: hypothetical protein H6981_15370 [Gammaproteobacteria bacterium]|nr:hypothetical protein [Gammaproteobacteria bacterium]MCP5138166.1 hypothetical protein [Gammaproteobacteria bacterium]
MRLERLVAAGILFMGSQAQAMLIESGSFIDEVERLKNLSFVSGSNLYVAPDLAQRSAFRSLANSIASGDTVSADAQAAALDYEVVEFTDSNTGNTYLGLREQLVNDQQTRGWGSYFFNTGADVQVLIEAPHPRFDTNSWEIAASIYRDVNAAGFLMAGAHRNANGVGTADVAHLTESIFQEVHEAWTGAGERDAWQIHGFNLDNHPIMPADTDAVVTAGDGSVSSGMLAVDAFLEAAGLVTYGYNTLDVNDVLNQAINGSVDGQDFAGLGATTNVQGDYTRSLGADFVHIEMEQSIRFDTNNRIAAAGAVVAAINSVEMPIPEPATLLLMLSATIPLLRRVT